MVAVSPPHMKQVRQWTWCGKQVYVDKILSRHPGLGIESWFDKRGSQCYSIPGARRLFHADTANLAHDIMRAEHANLNEEELLMYVLNVASLSGSKPYIALGEDYVRKHGNRQITKVLPIEEFKSQLRGKQLRRLLQYECVYRLAIDDYHTDQLNRIKEGTARVIQRNESIDAAVVFGKIPDGRAYPFAEIRKQICYPAVYHEANFKGTFGMVSPELRRIYIEEAMSRRS
jgi:hypothetical protein